MQDDASKAATKAVEVPFAAKEEAKVEPVDDSAFKAQLKDTLMQKSDLFEDMLQGEEGVRLGEGGWKQRYYEQKFGISDEAGQRELMADLRRSYVEGLAWVMRYYFDGVASWRWFYPFHYAPFASDLVGMASLSVRLPLPLCGYQPARFPPSPCQLCCLRVS